MKGDANEGGQVECRIRKQGSGGTDTVSQGFHATWGLHNPKGTNTNPAKRNGDDAMVSHDGPKYITVNLTDGFESCHQIINSQKHKQLRLGIYRR